ncbi:hypothetical protein DFH06DRAFT_438750 [Mycena polygramma]|nr:hypothetical protein DFH06DRAFT_438750 [Mycena polygramma]
MDAVCAADRARIANIEAEIRKLKRAIRGFRYEQDTIRARLDSYKYPVLTLPNELVSEIFLHFLPIYPACPPLTGCLSPNSLLQICRKWRQIALATPALWRAVKISFMHDEEQAPAVQAWLSRSGCYPLSIEAHQEMDIEGQLLDVIAAHCTRWEHVKLQLTLSDLPAHSSLPMLRQLELCQKLSPCSWCTSRAPVPARGYTMGFPLSFRPLAMVPADVAHINRETAGGLYGNSATSSQSRVLRVDCQRRTRVPRARYSPSTSGDSHLRAAYDRGRRSRSVLSPQLHRPCTPQTPALGEIPRIESACGVGIVYPDITVQAGRAAYHGRTIGIQVLLLREIPRD